VIDRTLANIASGIRKAKTIVEITQKRLDDSVEDKKRLDYVIKLNKDLTEIEGLEKIQSQIAVKSTTLRDIIKDVVRHSSQRDNAAQSTSGGLAALEKGQIWLKIKNLAKTLDNHTKTAIQTDKIIQNAPESISLLNKLKTQWIEHKEKKRDLEDLIDNIENSEERICNIKKELNQLEIGFKKITKERCPLCGSKIIKK